MVNMDSIKREYKKNVFQLILLARRFTIILTMCICFLLCQYMVTYLLYVWYNSLSNMLSSAWLVLAVIPIARSQAKWFKWAGTGIWRSLSNAGNG